MFRLCLGSLHQSTATAWHPGPHASASSVVYLLVAPTVMGLGSYELSLRTCSSLQPRLFRYSPSLCTAQQCLSGCSCPRAGCNATNHCSYTAPPQSCHLVQQCTPERSVLCSACQSNDKAACLAQYHGQQPKQTRYLLILEPKSECCYHKVRGQAIREAHLALQLSALLWGLDGPSLDLLAQTLRQACIPVLEAL